MLVLRLLIFLSSLTLPHAHSSHDEFSHLAYQSAHPHAHDPLPSFLSTARDIHLHAGVLTVQPHDILAIKQPTNASLSAHRRLLSTAGLAAADDRRHMVQLSSGALFNLRLPHTPALEPSSTSEHRSRSVHTFALQSVSPSKHSTVETPHQWLVHIKPPLTSSTLSHLAAVLFPYRLAAYLPHNSYTLVAPVSVAQQLTGEQDVLFVTEVEPEWKYHSDLITFLSERQQQHSLLAAPSSLGDDLAWFGNGTHSAGRRQRYHQLRVQLIEDNSTESVRNQRTCDDWEHYWNRHIEQLAPTQPPSIFTRVRCAVIDSQHLLLELPHHYSDLPVRSGLPNGTSEPLLSFWVRSLSHHPLIHFLSPSHTFTPLNKHARFVTQTDRFTSTHHYLTPAAQLNLTGHGVVIAIGDTGVDFDSCFFHDPHTPVPVNRVDTTHRKIITYITVEDPKKNKQRAAPGDSAGHGTHTAGSVAGEVMDPAREGHVVRPSVLAELGQYNGMAHGAKLVIHDFLIEGDGNLYVPENVYDEYLTAVVTLGAHISSNSWGDDQGVYDSYSQAVDRFLYLHPNHLMVMAAGNEGAKGLATIGTPACAKNVLTVGASLNHADSWAELGYNSAIEVSEPSDWRGALHVMPADFGQEYMESARHDAVGLVLAEPNDACTDLQRVDELKGKVVIVQRGTCKYYEKARRVQAAGGVLMIVVNNEAGAALPMTTDDDQPDITIPAVMMSQAESAHLTDSSNELFAQIRVSFPAVYDSTVYNERRLSSWSSRGPTQDGRTKPDIIAPGEYIQSAGSSHKLDDYQCGSVHERDKRTVMAMEGTSMATPIAAGNAAMLRQFFVEGKYKPPTPANTNPYDGTPGISFDPSSSLLKAMLAHGTVAVAGTVHESRNGQREVNVLPPPSVYQGHGRIQLDQVVNFPVQRDDGSVGVPFQLFLDDNSTLLSMQHALYCFRVTDASVPFKATLAWIDPPGALHSSLALVNQFDLVVTRTAADGVDGKVWAGNDRSEVDGTAMLWDTNNNLEKVTVAEPLPGLYQVVVRATVLPSGQAERYSLVVTGQYVMEAEAACPVDVYCPSNCNGRGRCNTAACQAGRGGSSGTENATVVRSTADLRSDNNGMCECDPHFAGADCGLNATELLPTSPLMTVAIFPNTWSLFYYDALPSTLGFNITITRVSPIGDPDFYLTHPHNRSYPTLAHWWRKDTQYDPGMKQQPPVHVFSVGGAPGELVVGTYMIGVWGYCCDVPTITVKLDVSLNESMQADAPYVRTLWPSEEGCGDVTPSANLAGSTAEASTAGLQPLADSVQPAEQLVPAADSLPPSLPTIPVAVLVAFYAAFPLSARPSLPGSSLLLALEWSTLFQRALPSVAPPAVTTMALTPTSQPPSAAPVVSDPSSPAEHREATMSSQQRAWYVLQLLLVANATAADEASQRTAATALMGNVRRIFELVERKEVVSSLDVTGPFAQCDVSRAYVAHPYRISCDDPSLQPALTNPTTAAAQSSDAVTPADTVPGKPSASMNDMSDSMPLEVQIGLLALSMLFFAAAYRLCFCKSAADELNGVDRIERQRPKPLVRHAVEEQHHFHEDVNPAHDEINTPASSASTASSQSTGSSASDGDGQPAASASFFSFGWLFGRREKVRFSALEQLDGDEQDGLEEEAEQRVERGGDGDVLATGGGNDSDGNRGVKLAITYR